MNVFILIAARLLLASAQQTVRCRHPPEVERAQLPADVQDSYPVGATVTYSCDFGYIAEGTSFTSECVRSSNGRAANWTDSRISCIPRSCGDPGFVLRARRIGSRFTFPNNVSFECEEGYTIRGYKYRFCQANGIWSGRLPSCERLACEEPSDPENGRAIVSSREYGTELKYECDKGYALKDDVSRYCEADGTWSGEKPECQEASCSMPTKPKNGNMELLGGQPKVGSIVFYTCDPGRNIIGSSTAKCLPSGEWNFPSPDCSEQCRVPEVRYGRIGRYVRGNWGSVSFKKYDVGDELKDDLESVLRCDKKYEPLGRPVTEVKIYCRYGKWDEEPICEPASCKGAAPQVNDARVTSTNRRHGGGIVYTCSKNFAKIPGNVTCNFGTWEGPKPICRDRRCSISKLNFPGIVARDKVTYSSGEWFIPVCSDGYRVARPSNSRITCNEGEWEGHFPPCTAGSCDTQPPFPKNGRPSHFTGIHSSGVSYTCDAFYVLENDGKVECSFGRWTGNPPTCRDTRCYLKDLPYKDAVRSDSPNATANEEYLDVKCDPGYRPSKSRKAYCSNGKWEVKGASPCKENECIIDEINQGFLASRSEGESYLNVRKLRYERTITYTKLQPGRLIPHNEQTFLVCRDGYTLQGERDANKLPLTCNKGQWTPEPVCWKTGTPYRKIETKVNNLPKESASTTRNYATSEAPPEVTTLAAGGLSQRNGNEDESCHCVYDLDDPNVVAYSGQDQLKFKDKVKDGCTVKFQCKDFGYARLNGLSELLCADCRTWHSSEFPNCVDPKAEDAIIYLDDNMKIQPDGTVSALKGVTTRFSCGSMNDPNFPTWSHPSTVKPVILYQNRKLDNDFMAMTYLDLVTPTENASGIYSCVGSSNRWNEVRLAVQEPETECAVLPEGNNFVIDYNGGRKVNGTAHFSCRVLLKNVVGPSTLKCLENGSWSESAPTTCEDITCPEFNDTSDGFVAIYNNDRKTGSRVMFHCLLPYERIGEASLICLENGSWSGPKANCSKKPCPVEQLFNGVLPEGVTARLEHTSAQELPYGTALELVCDNENMQLSGGTAATCGEDGRWEVGKVQCVTGCGSMMKSPDSQLIVDPDKDFYKFGDLITLSCLPGRKLNSPVERIMCLQNGWSEEEFPDCVAA